MKPAFTNPRKRQETPICPAPLVVTAPIGAPA